MRNYIRELFQASIKACQFLISNRQCSLSKFELRYIDKRKHDTANSLSHLVWRNPH